MKQTRNTTQKQTMKFSDKLEALLKLMPDGGEPMLRQLISDEIQKAYEKGFQFASNQYRTERDILLKDLQKAQTEEREAYGGCEKCYGKGYVTYYYGTTISHSSDGTPLIRNGQGLRACDCDRGKQLATFIAEEREAVLQEVERDIIGEDLACGIHQCEDKSLCEADECGCCICERNLIKAEQRQKIQKIKKKV